MMASNSKNKQFEVSHFKLKDSEDLTECLIVIGERCHVAINLYFAISVMLCSEA